jgi:hypothetical protein
MSNDSFWITNLTNRNVSLADLNLTIKAFSTVNLLDSKHYSYTREQLEKSKESGSLFIKRKMFGFRTVAPKIIKEDMPIIRTLYDGDNKVWSQDGAYLPSREKSVYRIAETTYEELSFAPDPSLDNKTAQQLADERFAEENAELAELDEQKSIKHKG